MLAMVIDDSKITNKISENDKYNYWILTKKDYPSCQYENKNNSIPSWG